MSRIHVLDSKTANAIAAGEVIERPMSIVKELMENSIDAGATQITVEISDGGITMIRVRDNGCGMDEEDAKNAFIIHATSKITSLDELFSLHSMGFRGEALASIAAVSRVTLSTREPLAEKGTCVQYEAGKFLKCYPVGVPSGTTVEVRDLFFNLPARFKFLKKDQTEANYIQVLVERFILCHTDISFKFIKNGKTVLNSPGNCDATSALYSVYGKDIVNSCKPINSSIENITVKGFCGLPNIARASRSEQVIFVNQRLIRSKSINAAIDAAYTNMLMKGKYAFVILDIYIPSSDIDVNVHPQKAEVRFSNESAIYRAVYHALVNTLASESMAIDYSFSKSEEKKSDSSSKPELNTGARAEAKREAKPEDKTEAKMESKPESKPAVKPEAKAEAISSSGFSKKEPSFADHSKEIGFSNLHFKENSVSYKTSSEVIPKDLPSKKQEKEENDQAVADSDIRSCDPMMGLPPVEEIPDTLLSTREESIHEFLSARVIGTLFDTYILLESDDKKLLMIDQHAAHEKILYEQLVEKEMDKQVVSQPLLSPVIISMSRSDVDFIEKHSSELEKLGFEISSMGDSDIALRAIPSQIDPHHIKDAFIAMVDEWMHASSTKKDALILSLATAACKAAVKGHDKLHDIEIRRLLEDLSKLKDPYHCPHGRPILIRISEKEIEKEFKRIV